MFFWCFGLFCLISGVGSFSASFFLGTVPSVVASWLTIFYVFEILDWFCRPFGAFFFSIAVFFSLVNGYWIFGNSSFPCFCNYLIDTVGGCVPDYSGFYCSWGHAVSFFFVEMYHYLLTEGS